MSKKYKTADRRLAKVSKIEDPFKFPTVQRALLPWQATKIWDFCQEIRELGCLVFLKFTLPYPDKIPLDLTPVWGLRFLLSKRLSRSLVIWQTFFGLVLCAVQ